MIILMFKLPIASACTYIVFFLVLNVFHRAPYGLRSRSNWTQKGCYGHPSRSNWTQRVRRTDHPQEAIGPKGSYRPPLRSNWTQIASREGVPTRISMETCDFPQYVVCTTRALDPSPESWLKRRGCSQNINHISPN